MEFSLVLILNFLLQGQCRGMIDKYIVNSLGVVALVLLWSSTGVISILLFITSYLIALLAPILVQLLETITCFSVAISN